MGFYGRSAILPKRIFGSLYLYSSLTIIYTLKLIIFIFISLAIISCSRGDVGADISWEIGENSKILYATTWRDGGSLGFAITDNRYPSVIEFCILTRNNGYEGIFQGGFYPTGNEKPIENGERLLSLLLKLSEAQAGIENINRTLGMDNGRHVNGKAFTDEDYEAEHKWFKSLPTSIQASADLGAKIIKVNETYKVFEQGDSPKSFSFGDR